MMNQAIDMFRTVLKAVPSNAKINHNDNILTIGSCFSERIGGKLIDAKFETMPNPFGTVYNPISIFKLLEMINVSPEGVVARDGLFYHHDFHSDFSGTDQVSFIETLNAKIDQVQKHLRSTNFLIITLGTAYVYEQVSSGEIVANCHKVPQKQFRKRLLSVKEMIHAFEAMKIKILQRNPELKIILTVSPVRHVKDGLSENNLSKSLLRVFCNTMEEESNVFYFPSYEIMMDDLRDYRFYQDDLLHPTSLAEDYIWDNFSTTYFSYSTRSLIRQWQSIRSSLNHRPFHPESNQHQAFLIKTLEKLKHFEGYWDVSEERKFFESQLS